MGNRQTVRRRWNARSGQTIILFSLAVIPLLGMTGLVVDVGWLYYRKEAAQTAADSAALAAALAAYKAAGTGGAMTCSTTGIACYADPTACAYPVPTTATDNIQMGCMYANSNGFANTGRQAVTMQSGIGTAPNAAGVTISYWVETRVSERVPQLFMGILGFNNGLVTARATTGASQSTSGGCIIALDPIASGAMTMSGASSLTTGCGVFVNSNSASAINTNGNGSITTTSGAKTDIVGNCNGCGNISPTPVTGVSPFGDPLAAMNPPPVGTCTDGGAGIVMGSHDSQTINPGVICGGINLGSHATLNLNPGLYVVKNGISLGAQTTLTGTGVTLYIQSGGVNMTGGATVGLSAPSSGSWQGILFYQDRADTTASTLVGGTTQSMNGVLYFPAASLTYTGGSALNATATTIVADTVTMVGNSNIAAPATSIFTGTSGGVALIE